MDCITPPNSGNDDPAPIGPTRRWNPERHVWEESLTYCRDTLGRWAHKRGDEPRSVLMLPFADEEAA